MNEEINLKKRKRKELFEVKGEIEETERALNRVSI